MYGKAYATMSPWTSFAITGRPSARCRMSSAAWEPVATALWSTANTIRPCCPNSRARCSTLSAATRPRHARSSCIAATTRLSYSPFPTSLATACSLSSAERSPARTGFSLSGSVYHRLFLDWIKRRGQAKACPTLVVERWLDIRGTVTMQAGGGDGLRKNDADRDKDCARARRERHGYFHTGPFRILIPASEAQPAFRQVFADHDFFREAPSANARQHARLYPC